MGTDLCNQTCTNTPGSFECGCLAGYNENGFNCIGIFGWSTNFCTSIKNVAYMLDINECELGFDDCDDPRIADCINNPGNFSCICKTGYTGSGRIGTCEGD